MEPSDCFTGLESNDNRNVIAVPLTNSHQAKVGPGGLVTGHQFDCTVATACSALFHYGPVVLSAAIEQTPTLLALTIFTTRGLPFNERLCIAIGVSTATDILTSVICPFSSPNDKDEWLPKTHINDDAVSVSDIQQFEPSHAQANWKNRTTAYAPIGDQSSTARKAYPDPTVSYTSPAKSRRKRKHHPKTEEEKRKTKQDDFIQRKRRAVKAFVSASAPALDALLNKATGRQPKTESGHESHVPIEYRWMTTEETKAGFEVIDRDSKDPKMLVHVLDINAIPKQHQHTMEHTFDTFRQRTPKWEQKAKAARGNFPVRHLGCWFRVGRIEKPYMTRLYRGGEADYKKESVEIPNGQHMAADPFCMVTLNFNAITARQKDCTDTPDGICVVYCWGEFEGGELIFDELELVVPLQPGHLVMFRSALLTHWNIPVKMGIRKSFVLFIDKRMHTCRELSAKQIVNRMFKRDINPFVTFELEINGLFPTCSSILYYMPRPKNRQGAGSKRGRMKRRDKKKRAAERLEYEDRIISMLGTGLEATNRPIIRRHKRDEDMEDILCGQIVEYSNPLIDTFKTIDGRSSCTYVVVDKQTNKLAFVVKVSLYKDMTATEEAVYRRLFDYFTKDQKIKGHQHLKNGPARQGKGHMNAVGWRPGYQTGVNVDSYTSGHGRNGRFTYNQIRQHETQLQDIHSTISSSLRSLSSLIQENQNAELRQYGTPAAGMPYGADGLQLDGCFCSNIAYTYDGFYNSMHKDKDASSYTYGMFGRTRNGRLSGMDQDGGKESISGFSFLNIPYRIRVLLADIDGIAEIIWRGPTDCHGTTTGIRHGAFDRMGFTCQIASGLVARVARHSTQYSPDHPMFVEQWDAGDS
ncbi:hypothetical protein BJ508DRAFT_308167 [Ascobolus immersus RN42]|uniref:Tet-like 2OG-Fe(II) oxygenase domain-containing protein n=1 Tax=Ascobolus immersus RN42 TaxID=1160509 RepID=A0A3N4I4R4_ASCIM|nr:hypothetical protein BJ508DRAFT_308167 [Ascobolus immersus RN42]